MIRPTHSEQYTTIRLSYPEHYNGKCPLCNNNVTFQYANGGKLVHCLDRTIYQITNLYICTNPECKLSNTPFNPTVRFDYGGRSWGADVLRYIAKEFLLIKMNPKQILDRLMIEYPSFEISLDSIRRIMDDILLLKAHRIDEHTLEIITNQGQILLGLDGQDPDGNGPSVWLFMDLLSGRVLSTQLFESLNYESLYLYIQNLLTKYKVPLVGWVSDKQGVLVKCHDTYFKDIPMQYCQFHFLSHLWNHLECLDSTIFMPLKAVINKLYIHTSNQEVFFEGKGNISVKEAFKPMDLDFQRMIKVRNKKFNTLRGVWLYETLSVYLQGMEKTLQKMNSELRAAKIMKNCYEKVKDIHDHLHETYQDAVQLRDWFESIRSTLADSTFSVEEQKRRCELIEKAILSEILRRDPTFCVDACRSFLPNKNNSYISVLGEYLRLWKSYSPGLFQYVHFPKSIRTNGDLERTFSVEKTLLVSRAGKGTVSHMVSTRGEAYIRIQRCDPDELKRDIILDYEEELVQQLRTELKSRIKEITQHWRSMSISYYGYDGVSLTFDDCLEKSMTKKEVR